MSIVDEIIAKGIPHQRSGNGVLVHCPFHDDSTPSLWVTPDNFAYCFGCGWRKHVDSFPELGINGSHRPRRVRPRRRYPPPKGLDEELHHNLLRNERKMEYLFRRGITLESIYKYKLGYGTTEYIEAPRYSIPVYDRFGNLINIKMRKDPDIEDGDGRKYVSYPNAYKYIYCEDLVDKDKPVVLVGGEFDCIVARQCGLNAVATMSESVPKDIWLRGIVGDALVIIMYDKDDAGIRLGKRAAKIIGSPVVVGMWPELVPWGFDLSDIYSDFGDEFIRETVEGLGRSATRAGKTWWE